MAQTIAILGAPLDLGAGRRGVDMGPSALRVANLNAKLVSLGYKVEDLGNVFVSQQESSRIGAAHARYLKPIAATCVELAHKVERAAGQGKFPLVLGGDHSVAVGTVSGMAQHFRKKKQKLGVIWLDAHTDMNTPDSSPSGNVHGMPLACLVGYGPKPLTHLYGYAPKVDAKNVVLVGIRDVDLTERPIVKQSGVRVFTMRDIDERGLRSVMEEAVMIASQGTAGIHISLDMDGVDPDEAPGVGTPVRGGFSYREAHLAMEILSDSHRVRSMEVVEVNPVLDTANRTALLGVELVMSAMGKRIL
ncbi:arginase [Paludibaculum fermentans]|uniref:Arginase n=1 Tax=Paludibaculum fermentans TaxID=1473598 RepID=A0A7S7NLC5_PALFE|nr:arginase [Paludibaculum fermentans]QOY85669.1 arginase [Paludibaculum fermentans]